MTIYDIFIHIKKHDITNALANPSNERVRDIISGRLTKQDMLDEYERDIDIEYLHRLNIYYKRWFEQIDDFNILEIDTNNFNIFKDKKMFNKICKDIESKL